MHNLEGQYNTSQLIVAELHPCGGSPCDEKYMPADNIQNHTVSYYQAGGYPTVVVDGDNMTVGVMALSTPVMQQIYKVAIDHELVIPGNVSITQNSTIVSKTVHTTANVTSGVTGTYQANMYLVEFIGKAVKATGGTHDVDYVTRLGMTAQNLSLVAGQTTSFSGTAKINPTWNVANLSVIAFVQTWDPTNPMASIVQNANIINAAGTPRLTASATATPTKVTSGQTTAISVHVNSTAAISGATVTLKSNNGGSFSPISGATSTKGFFNSTFTAPTVTTATICQISATATMSGYTSGSGSTNVLVEPSPPGVPTALAASPGNTKVSLGWVAPASGGAVANYNVYRSTTH